MDEPEGSKNIAAKIRVELNLALKLTNKSRFEVAGEMSHLLGQDVSKFMLDAWTAESKEGHRMPAEFLPAFCEVTGHRGALSVMNEAAGMFSVAGPDALRAEIQKLDEDAKRLREAKKKRTQLLKEIERRSAKA